MKHIIEIDLPICKVFLVQNLPIFANKLDMIVYLDEGLSYHCVNDIGGFMLYALRCKVFLVQNLPIFANKLDVIVCLD